MATKSKQSTGITRGEFNKMFKDEPKEYQEKIWNGFEEAKRVADALESMGLEVDYREHLLSVSNVETCWQGHLKNATLRKQWQVVIKGRGTFPIKEDLKAMGFSWDRQHGVWFRPMTEEGKTPHDHMQKVRYALIEGGGTNGKRD